MVIKEKLVSALLGSLKYRVLLPGPSFMGLPHRIKKVEQYANVVIIFLGVFCVGEEYYKLNKNPSINLAGRNT